MNSQEISINPSTYDDDQRRSAENLKFQRDKLADPLAILAIASMTAGLTEPAPANRFEKSTLHEVSKIDEKYARGLGLTSLADIMQYNHATPPMTEQTVIGYGDRIAT